MAVLKVSGGSPLYGEIQVQGSKNGVLPVLTASLLCRGTVVIHNVPDIEDVRISLQILEHLGAHVYKDGHSVEIDSREIVRWEIPRHYVTKMRSSVIFIGALLARMGQCEAYYPGGCMIGSRPIDYHLMAFRQMGARIQETDGKLCAQAPAMDGKQIRLPFPSVGATENILLAAVAAQGQTVIENAAREPEIMELCWFLESMGAKLSGAGTSRIVIQGGFPLTGCEYRIAGDRIVAGTYLTACLAVGGKVTLHGVPLPFMTGTLSVLAQAGGLIRRYEDTVCITQNGRPLPIRRLQAEPYPGFPTDMQSIVMAALCKAEGISEITDTVFESRFTVAKELRKLGADIRISPDNRTAVIVGQSQLTGAGVTVPDLRAGASLVVAGLAAEKITQIEDQGHILRGYESLDRDVQNLGGNICWEK